MAVINLAEYQYTLTLDDTAYQSRMKNAEATAGSMQSKLANVGNFLKTAFVAGLAAAATATVALGKSAIDAYADYEQLAGGVETLFGNAADAVKTNAANAFETAGLSANEYMQTVTSFSASLLQSLGGDTEKAAEMADQAITDMADNANKMGTDMAAIQNAYQGFAKQNYTMLDNLKLGYGGTKEEMQRLLEDATALSGIEYDISSYADVVAAIHVVQTELGITGTTAKEASTTISGSIASMKAAWKNLLTEIAGGDNVQGALSETAYNFAESIMTVVSNLIPRIIETAKGLFAAVPEFVRGLGDVIRENINSILPEGMADVVVTVMDTVSSTFDSVVAYITPVINTLKELFIGFFNTIKESDAFVTLQTTITTILAAVQTAIQTFTNLVKGVWDLFGADIMQTAQTAFDNILNVIQNVLSVITDVFTLFTSVLKGDWDGAFEALKSIAADGWELIESVFEAVVEPIANILTRIIDAVKQWATDMISKAKEAVTNFVSNIIDGVKNLPTRIYETIKSAIAKVSSWGSEMKTAAVNAMSTLVSGIVNALSGLPGQMVSIGTNLVQGIWNGINNAVGWVLDKIRGFGASVVAGIKDIFGIASPSKLMRDEVGKYLAEGIGVGFEDEIKNVNKQIQDAINTDFQVDADVLSNIHRSPAYQAAAVSTPSYNTNSDVSNVTNNNGDTDNSSIGEVVINNTFNTQSLNEEDAKQFADYYSDYTIGKLISAKKRKGLKNSVGSHMLR